MAQPCDDAEGATAPESLRQKDRFSQSNSGEAPVGIVGPEHRRSKQAARALLVKSLRYSTEGVLAVTGVTAGHSTPRRCGEPS